MKLNVSFREDEIFHVGFESVQTVTLLTDYDLLTNKPKINGVELQGDMSLEDIGVGTGGGTTNFPEGGFVGDVLMKTGAESNNVSWVTPASSSEEDNTRPITAAAVYTEIGNINALLATI